MTPRLREWLLGVWAALLVLLLAVAAIQPAAAEDWPWAAGLMAFPIAAALVLTRRPGNAIGRALGGVGAAATVIFTLSWYAEIAPGGRFAAHAELVVTLAAVAQFGALLLLIHLFPTGRPVGRRHRWVVRALFVWWGVLATAALLRPGPVEPSGRPNPFGIGGELAVVVMDSALICLPLFAAAGVAALFVRRRTADVVERAQLKWFFAAAATVAAMLLMIVTTPQSSSPAVELGAGLLVVAGFWSLPLSIVVAITRHGLFEIDQIVSRTVTYTVVAACLAGVYAGSVVVLQSVLPSSSSSFGVALSTLAAAALFRPLRRRVRTTLDRRFNRSHYEAEQVAQQFALRLRQDQAVEPQTVASDLRDFVVATVQPSQVQVWLNGAPPPR